MFLFYLVKNIDKCYYYNGDGMYQDDDLGYNYEENDSYNEIENNHNNYDYNDNISNDYDYDNSSNKKSKPAILIIILAVIFIILLIFLFLSCDKKEVIPIINIMQDKVYLKLNSTSNLPIELINAENTNINWQSDNSDIVEVDQNGNIFGIKLGSSNITVTYVDRDYKNYNDSCEIIVHEGDVDIPLNDIIGLNNIRVKKGNVYNLSLKFSPSNAYIYNIKYEIDDSNIATINDLGEINGLQDGKTKLNIVINDSFTRTVEIEVYDNVSDNEIDNNDDLNIKPNSVKFDQDQIDLMVNSESKLVYSVFPNSSKNYNVSFENNNDTVLKLENDGRIKGISVGTAVVTIKINNSITDTIVVNVKPFVVNVNQIILQSSNNISMNIGETSQIMYDILPQNASNKVVKFSSTNSNVASVDVNGVITATGSGTCIIVAESIDGSKSVKINVNIN